MGEAFENQFVSRRGPGGWSTQTVTPPQNPSETSLLEPYNAIDFNPELTSGLTVTNVALASGAISTGEETDWYYVDNFAGDSYQYVGTWGGFRHPGGVSTDLSHVFYGELIERSVWGEVNDWVNGKTTLANVTNQGETLYAEDAEENKSLWHAMSADGSRIYFTSSPEFPSGGKGILYLRENAEQPQSPMNGEVCTDPSDACTVEVSASQRPVADPHGPQEAHFVGASADGSKAFFTSNAELTEDANTGPADNAANLYEYDVETGKLTDLSVDAGAPEGAKVLGLATISENGSRVYFVAEGAMAADAVAGAPNLYVSQEGGAPKFIATLAAGERGSTDYRFSPEINAAITTPSGSRMAFISELNLTGYDTEQATQGDCEGQIDDANDEVDEDGRCREIYIYDAETGGLVCASCNPSGARPVGPSKFHATFDQGSAGYLQHNLLENGTLFFESNDQLVPHTSDGRENVYEYEDGQVNAISDVAGGYESFFVDASPNGENVFFGSADQLLPEDTSNSVMVWDARVDGGFPVSTAPPPCNSGDQCKPPPTPQPGAFGTPSSSTFSGPGDIPTPPPPALAPTKTVKKTVKCKKGFAKNKKGKCVRQKAKKHKAKAKKSAHTDRRASR